MAIKKLHHAIAQDKVVFSTMALLEVKYTLIKRLGHEKAKEAMFTMKKLENTKIVSVDQEIAETAADIRTKYYKNKEREMSFADSIHIATAIVCGCETIITGDPDFRNLDGIKTDIY